MEGKGDCWVIIDFPLAFVYSAGLRELQTKEIENGHEERCSNSCNIAKIADY